jgi:hypothetical protein
LNKTIKRIFIKAFGGSGFTLFDFLLTFGSITAAEFSLSAAFSSVCRAFSDESFFDLSPEAFADTRYLKSNAASIEKKKVKLW